MRSRSRAALIAALAVGLVAQSAWAAPLSLDAATQRRLGIATAPLAPATRGATVTGYAKVLDPIPLATLDSDIATAAAVAAASQAEARRARALHAADATVAAKVAEVAEAQARGDAAKLTLLRHRVGLEWGSGVARLSDSQRGALLKALAAGRAALVRIDASAGQGLAGLRSVEIDLGPQGMAHAVVLGSARTADPRLLSSGVIAEVTGPQAAALATGLSAPVRIAVSRPTGGVILPRSALIRTAGQTWAYVRKAPTQFERRAVTGGITDPAGLFAPVGFKPGEAVVTAGASALFAAENAHPAGEP